MNLQLSVALGDYDHLRDLMSGVVRAPGIDITAMHPPVEEMFFRFTQFKEWDVCEMSFAKSISIMSQPDPWLALIPVFPSRAFRHSSIYVRAGGGIHSPKDLEGKKVGLPEWAQTAAIYSRGLLAHEYGVDLQRIDWYQAGVNDAGRKEKVKLQLPSGLHYTPMPHTSLSAMLLSGELDAVLSARPPQAFVQHPDQVQRLIPNYREVEQAYWKKTGIFPIMHVVAIKRSTYERHPWIAMNLMQGFEAAKQRSLVRASDITASSYPLPWVSDHAAAAQDVLGKDFWPYGISANQATLDAFCQYAHEQGVTHRRIGAEDIFVPETLQSFKV